MGSERSFCPDKCQESGKRWEVTFLKTRLTERTRMLHLGCCISQPER